MCSQLFCGGGAHLLKNSPVFKTGKNNKRLLYYLIQDDKGRFFPGTCLTCEALDVCDCGRPRLKHQRVFAIKNVTNAAINLSACMQTSLAFLPWE